MLDVSYHFRFVLWMFRPVTFRPTGCFVLGRFVPHKAKKTGSSKLRSKFETLRREIRIRIVYW